MRGGGLGHEDKFQLNWPGYSLLSGRDVLARDEPTRTCCGPLPSWAPKIKTLEKIKNVDFNFEFQD